METNATSFIEQAKVWLQNQETIHLVIGGIGAVLLLVLLILLLRRLFRPQRKALPTPNFVLDTVQIAPLGRDAFVKIRNTGHDGVITGLKVLGRHDIKIKNDVPGHELDAGKVYSLLFEAASTQRLDKNFGLLFTYLDKQGNAYEQQLQLGAAEQPTPKLVMRKRG